MGNEEKIRELVGVTLNYQMQGNVWDAMLFLGVDVKMGCVGNTLILFAALTNIVVQLGICFFTVQLAIAQGNRLNRELVNQATQWNHGNTAEVVQRVCDHDFTLDTNHGQILAHELYEEYFANTTQVLCVAVLVIWTFTVLREASLVTHFVRAVTQVRLAGRTVLELHHGKVDIVCLNISTRRIVFATALVELAICGLLLFAGAWWLAASDTQEDLLLNSVALSFVMDIDELVYAMMCPHKVRSIIAQMRPISYDEGYRSVGVDCLGRMFLRWVRPVGTFSFVLCVVLFSLDPRVSLMREFLDAICA